jgi:cell wall-associated NlpC family hydrolase
VPVSLPAGVIRLDEAARQWLGVPFVHQGRTEWALDCVGLLVMAARGAGIPIQDRTDYPPASASMVAMMRAGSGCAFRDT